VFAEAVRHASADWDQQISLTDQVRVFSRYTGGREPAMRQYSSKTLPGFFSIGLVLLVLPASGIRLCGSARSQSLAPRATELPGFIGAQFHSGPMGFSPDGKSLALPKRADGRVELWGLETGRLQGVRSSPDQAKSPADRIAFSNDGHFLAVCYRDKGVTVWDLDANKQHVQIPVAPNFVDEMAFDDGQRTLVTVLARRSEEDRKADRWNYTAVHWEISTGAKLETHVFDPFLLLLALSPNGRYAILQQHKVGQIVFDLRTGKKAFAIKLGGGFLFSDDGSTLVSYDGDHVSLWEVPAGRKLIGFSYKPGCSPEGYDYTDCLALSHDKKVLAIGGFTETSIVGLIDVESGRILDTFECCPRSMMCDTICFSPDGRTLATDTYPEDKLDRKVQPLLKFWKMPAWSRK
jgi:WD40 repeat protein